MSTPLIVAGAVALFVIFIIWGAIAKRKRDTAWRQLATEIGATFVDGGFMHSSKVQMPFKQWTITLYTYSVSSGDDSSTTYTRLSAPIQDAQGFQFTLLRKNIVTKIDHVLGAKEIATGDAEFDRTFAVRGNDDTKERDLFSHARICQLYLAERALTGSLRKNVLSLEIMGDIKDVERLKTFFEMFKETLGQLSAWLLLW
jgi:hypothetical protein